MGNLHQGGPQYAVVEPVTGLHLLNDRAFLVFIGLLAGNRLVLGRIELLTDRGYGRNALALEDLVELPGYHLDALEPVRVDVRGRMFQRPSEVVEDREQ